MQGDYSGIFQGSQSALVDLQVIAGRIPAPVFVELAR